MLVIRHETRAVKSLKTTIIRQKSKMVKPMTFKDNTHWNHPAKFLLSSLVCFELVFEFLVDVSGRMY